MPIALFKQKSLSFVRRALVSIESRLEAETRHKSIIDAASVPEHFNPLTLHYPARFPCLVNVPLTRGIGFDLFPLEEQSHPFVRALILTRDKKYQLESIKLFLREYYERVQNINAHDWIGLTPPTSIYEHYASWARCLPWSYKTPENSHRAIVENAYEDTKNAGHGLDISHGWKTVGPVSNELLHIEALRLRRLALAIPKDGFVLERRGKGVNVALLYSHNQEWRWMVAGGGEHRVAVATALNISSIPVYVQRLIRRDEVDAWPQVRRGHITREDALAFFDRLMEGELPPALQHWADFVTEEK